MAWAVELAETAARELERTDPTTRKRVLQFLRERVATSEDPRRLGRPLVGSRRGLWRYRVGDYRRICDIQDRRLVVLVVTVGHRREVYR